MICSQNEKYLLKFISSQNEDSSDGNNLLDVAFNLGIKLKFQNQNPVYQIIDELIYSKMI